MSSRYISRLLSRSHTSFQLSNSSYLHPVSSFLNTYNLFSLNAGNFRSFTTPQMPSSSIDFQVQYWYAYLPPTQEDLEIGCDYQHWFVEVDQPQIDKSRDEIIDSYVKTLATVVGSEEEARMKIYSVSTRCYYAFGALVSVEHSYNLKELPHVRSVEPDSYLCVKNKDYGVVFLNRVLTCKKKRREFALYQTPLNYKCLRLIFYVSVFCAIGEPFINGKAVPYDPNYHKAFKRLHNECPDTDDESPEQL